MISTSSLKGCGPSSRWQACIRFEQIEVCGDFLLLFCFFIFIFFLVLSFFIFLKRCSHFHHIQKKVSGYLVCFKKLALQRQVGEGMILPHTPSMWCSSCLQILNFLFFFLLESQWTYINHPAHLLGFLFLFPFPFESFTYKGNDDWGCL